MGNLVVRVVSGGLAAAIILGVIARPPQNTSQAIGAALPSLMLIGVAIRGTRRSALPKKKKPSPPPSR